MSPLLMLTTELGKPKERPFLQITVMEAVQYGLAGVVAPATLSNRAGSAWDNHYVKQLSHPHLNSVDIVFTMA